MWWRCGADMAAALTDEAWAEICKAGLRHKARLTPDPDARAELDAILFVEFPVLARRDRKTVQAALRRSKAMLRHLNAFAEAYRQAWLPHLPVDEFQAILTGRAVASFDNGKTGADLWGMQMLRRRPEASWLADSVLWRAMGWRKPVAGRKTLEGRKNAYRQWLVSRLCGVWLNWFRTADGRHLSYEYLTITRPTLGGLPEGPLIEFLTVAIGQVMPGEVPDPETLHYAIERERKEHGDAAQLKLQLPAGGWRRGVGI